MKKNALVISGGGAKGSFAVGVIKYIYQNTPLRFDIICGTSTGALIAPFAALENVAKLEEVYTTTKTGDIILQGDLADRFVNHNSLFDVSPLIALVKKFYTQQVFDQLTAASKQIFLATVCLQTAKVVHFSTMQAQAGEGYDVIKMQSWDDMIRAIIASANQPIFTPPVHIPAQANPPRQYVDGGVREYAPIRAALDNGATDIYVIHLSPETQPEENKDYKNIFDILLRTMAIFSEDVGENDLVIPQLYNRFILYVDAVKKNIEANSQLSQATIDQLFNLPLNPLAGKSLRNLHVIYPDYKLVGLGGLEFDPVEMKKYLNHGFDKAKLFFENNPGKVVGGVDV